MNPISKQLTLVLVHRVYKGERQVLLGLKKRGFGEGKWNGFGGKVEKGETIHEAAIRELEEEACIITKSLQPCGELIFQFQDMVEIMHVHVFQTETFKGSPQETDEMKPQWFHHLAIPYDKMWTDDKFWLPLVLDGYHIKGKFNFASDQSTILSHELSKTKLKNP